MIAYIALPALVALIVKLTLLAYALRSPLRSNTARLFLSLLVVFALHNLSEFVLLNHYSSYGLTPAIQSLGFAYIALIALVFALILHVSLRLGLDIAEDNIWTKLQTLLYLPVVGLLYLLLFTDQLVTGFQPFKNTLLRVPGPWYVLFETFAVGCMVVALLSLCYGARTNRPSIIGRRRSRWWLLALSPTALLTIYLIVANHFNLAKLTSTIYLPITWTFFLVVTTYVTTGSWRPLPTQQYRLFDIAFFIPWSNIRRHKKAFYARIQTTIAELGGLASVNDALARVAELLRCPVALIGGSHPVLVHAGAGSLEMAQFPHDELEKIDRPLVTNEIADTMPRTYQLMRQFGVAMVVPYYPHTKTAASWMLLGDSFGDSVYTPLDFKNVERLLNSLGEFFLDKVGLMQSELADAEDRIQSIQRQLDTSAMELEKAREESRLLRTFNFRLLRETGGNRSAIPNEPTEPPNQRKTLDERVKEFEANLIRRTLESCGGNKAQAARLLGLRPNTLHYKIERYRIGDADESE